MTTDKPPYTASHVTMWIKDGILQSKYPVGLVVTLEIAKQIVRDRIVYTEGSEYPAIADIRNIAKVEFNAMKYWASEEAYSSISKFAVYSNKIVSKVIYNFWFNVDKPFRPTRYFTNIDKAYIFLQEMPIGKN